MSAAAASLASFKVAVAGACCALALSKFVGVHCQAHGATRFAPIEASLDKDFVETFGLCLFFNHVAAGHNHCSFHRDGAAFDDVCGCAQIFDAAVGARANENCVDTNVANGGASNKTHVRERAVDSVAGGGVVEVGWVRNNAVDAHHLCGVGAPRNLRRQRAGINEHFFVPLRAFVGLQCFPVGKCCVPRCTLRRKLAALEISKRCFVWRNEAGFRACFDAHVADGHATFHRQSPNCRTAVFDDMTDAASSSNLADDCKDDVFGGDAGGQHAINSDAHPLWPGLHQRLCGKHVFYFAGADAKSERTECAVRGGVAVAANNGHAWKRAALLGADDMHDALLLVAHWVERDVELFCIGAHYFKLLGRDWVGNWQVNVGCWNVVILGGNGEVWPAHWTIINTKAVKRLRARYLMDEMQVDVQQVGFAGLAGNNVAIPHFLGQGLGRACC